MVFFSFILGAVIFKIKSFILKITILLLAFPVAIEAYYEIIYILNGKDDYIPPLTDFRLAAVIYNTVIFGLLTVTVILLIEYINKTRRPRN